MILDLIKEAVDSALLNKIPAAFAERYQLLPVYTSGNKLVVAMADPLNVVALDDLQTITGMQIEPAVATETEILEGIKLHFSRGSALDKKLISDVQQSINDTAREAGAAVSAEQSQSAVEDAPIVRLVNSIIEQAVLENASDIHIEPLESSLRVRYRIDGILREVLSPPLQAMPAIVSRIKILANLDISEKRLPQDGRIELNAAGQQVDLRISTLPTIFGEKLVIRILNKTAGLLKLANLGMQSSVLEKYQDLLKRSHGMLLVTGPTGSGKTTTLYATIQEINNDSVNIVTIEDPVEYQMHGVNQVAVNPKIGITFANALRSILRQDPNVIMVGEIRDRETAEISIRSALTGHLVISTLHTNDASSALIRLVDMGLEPFLVTSAVRGIVAQRLVRRVCERCKEPYELSSNAPERAALGISADEKMTFFRGRGCEFCHHTGYKGRVAIFELLALGPEERELLLQGANSDQIRDKALEDGMITLQADGILKAMAGLTTINEVIRVAYLD